MKRTSSLFLLAALLSPLPAIAQSDALDSQKLKLEHYRVNAIGGRELLETFPDKPDNDPRPRPSGGASGHDALLDP